MSREIKFRGWDTRKNVMYSSEEMGKDQLTLSVDGRGFINVSGRSTELSTFATHIIAMQYTGLKDKNGKEIYEGDIVNWKGMECGDTMAYGKDLIDVVGEIRCGYGSNEWIRNSANQCEVIGNIHETPELLEGK